MKLIIHLTSKFEHKKSLNLLGKWHISSSDTHDFIDTFIVMCLACEHHMFEIYSLTKRQDCQRMYFNVILTDQFIE